MAGAAHEKALPVFASLASTKTLAPWFVAACGAATMIEGLAASGAVFLVAGLVFLAPTFAAGIAASDAARAQWKRAFAAAAIGAGVQAAAAVAFAMLFTGPRLDGIVGALGIALVTTTLTAIVGLPLIIAAGVLGSRRDLAAGDAMLGAGGVWLVLVQLVKMAVMPECAFGFLPALALGGVAIGIRVARGFARRSWANRVARGEVHGWRVRADAGAEELAVLPPLFPASPSLDRVPAILERVVVGGALYRSGLVGQPVASLTSRLRLSP